MRYIGLLLLLHLELPHRDLFWRLESKWCHRFYAPHNLSSYYSLLFFNLLHFFLLFIVFQFIFSLSHIYFIINLSFMDYDYYYNCKSQKRESCGSSTRVGKFDFNARLLLANTHWERRRKSRKHTVPRIVRACECFCMFLTQSLCGATERVVVAKARRN